MSGPKTILERLDLEEPSEIIDDAMAEIARLTSERDEARAKAIEECADALHAEAERLADAGLRSPAHCVRQAERLVRALNGGVK